MLVPRIIYSPRISSVSELNKDFLSADAGLLPLIDHLDRMAALQIVHQLKVICLDAKTMLFLYNLEFAALINADGNCCMIDDNMQGRARDVLGEDKLVGGTAHTIQDVANFYEEGMVDFVILRSYAGEENSDSLLGKHKTQSIIDDARIMGYNIPILLADGINSSNAADALSTGAYGVMTSDLSNIEDLKRLLATYPVR